MKSGIRNVPPSRALMAGLKDGFDGPTEGCEEPSK